MFDWTRARRNVSGKSRCTCRDGFREATVIAVAIVGVGATVVHVIDILQGGNLAPGNSIQNVANLLRPALLIPMLIVSRRS
jgi:hypothetical protein